ncbi:Hypothetical protein, putative [Bodo saltans]|uniref:Uncharacterized protein n=1 Tax=Bodo saltans TaxID=75058 RepID=A0A0S4IMV8_BODSA|nr:Hypothetical protein, putative [Bodo saltans]|eukprot:CUE74572.1 Hypothetical protein, putative [Bodo saltans]
MFVKSLQRSADRFIVRCGDQHTKCCLLVLCVAQVNVIDDFNGNNAVLIVVNDRVDDFTTNKKRRFGKHFAAQLDQDSNFQTLVPFHVARFLVDDVLKKRFLILSLLAAKSHVAKEAGVSWTDAVTAAFVEQLRLKGLPYCLQPRCEFSHVNLNGATIPLQEELLSGKSCNSPAYLKQNPLSSISKAASRQGCAQVNEALHQHVGTHSLAIVLEHTTASETSTSTQIIQKLQHRDDGGAPIIVICASNAKVNKLISEVALFEKNITRLGRTSSNSEILLDTFAFEHSPRHHEHNRLEKQIHSQKQLLSFLLNATSELTAADAPQATFDTILSACPDELQCAVKFSSEELERQFNEDQQEIEVLLLSKKKQLEDLQKFDCQPPHGLDDEQRVLHCLEAEAQKKVLQDEFDSTCEKILEQTQQLTERENRHITIPSLHRCVMRCFHNNLIDFSALDNYDATTETLSRDCYALIGIINSCRAFGCTTSDLRVDIFWWLCCIAVRQTKLNLHNLNLRFNDVVIHHSKSIADALGNKSVIFATPASAAMYIDAIQSIKSEVVLVEEADILCEWQVLPCLPNSIQHLILVSQEMNLDRNYHRSESMLERLKRIGALIFKTSACSFKLKCGHQCGSPKEFCCGSTVWYEHWPCVICPVSQRTDVKKSSEKAIKSLMLLARKLCDGAPLNVYQKKVWIDHLDQYAHVVKLLLAPNANWKPKHRQQLFLKLNNLERQIVLIDTYLGDPGPKNILQTFIVHFKYLVRWKDTLDAIEIKVMRYRVDAIQNLSRYLFTIRLNKATVSDQFSCLLQRVLQTPPCDVQTFSDLASDARMLVIQPLLEKAAEALRNSNEFPDLQLKFVPSKYLPRCRALRRFVEVVGPDLECITDVVEIAFHGTPQKKL